MVQFETQLVATAVKTDAVARPTFDLRSHEYRYRADVVFA